MAAILEYLTYHQLEFLILVGILGLVIGSFLTVVIYRLPKIIYRAYQEECYAFLKLEKPIDLIATEKFSLLFPRSRCPHCKHSIAAWQNIPLVSYALLLGKCFYCRNPISLQYPAIESLTAALSIIVAWQFGVSILTVMGLMLTWCFIAQAFIDLEHFMIPDEITLPCLWLGLIISFFHIGFVNLEDALLGAVIGYLTLLILYATFKLLTKKEGIGFGDLKLLAMIGAWLGWQMLPQILFISAVLGTLFGLCGIIFQAKSKDTPIPFGPYLVITAWIAMLWGDIINNAYLRLLAITEH